MFSLLYGRMLNICKTSVFGLLILIFCCQSQANDELSPPSLRTGFYFKSFPDIARADMETALRFWSEEIAKQVGITSSIYIYDSLDKMRTDFDQNKINFIVASSLSILNKFDITQLVDGYKVVISGQTEDNLLVLTHRQTQLQSMNTLKNKRISLLINDPISGMYMDVFALTHFGKKAQQVFKEIDYAATSNKLVLQLFFNNTDVIFVYQSSYDLACELNPQIRVQTQIIDTLPGIPRALGFFQRRVKAEFREQVLTEVAKLDTHPRGQQLLALFYADKVIRSHITDLKSTRQLQQKYQQLLRQSGYR